MKNKAIVSGSARGGKVTKDAMGARDSVQESLRWQMLFPQNHSRSPTPYGNRVQFDDDILVIARYQPPTNPPPN